ncbi:MAG: alpha-ketoacid dehydrogenase subunit beta [Candidatus Omnitrophica bacterium]|nr:alpha-ketoacid dehydrogenase subunit beta [Candidatus Omnitrophota bacterium]
MRNATYREAINEALIQEMERDPGVFVYGIDVADHKRIFGTTKNLLEKFGAQRCFSTPLSEDAMTGFGLGAAINGLRPVHVHMRVDFMLLAMNQLVNMISSLRYSTRGNLKAPMVIRAVIGKGWGQSFQHTKTLHSCLAHIPGLKVAMPSTPNEAKGILISAIREDNPVIVIEHRFLYDINGPVPVEPVPFPLGKGKVLRIGDAITVIAISFMNVEAVKAAEILSRKHNVNIEVIDPVSICPLDEDLIVASVKKTGHCIIADNDWVNCGFSAEVSSRINERCFGLLKSPVKRIGFAPVPCPCTRPLEDEFYPNAIDIIRAVEEKLDLPNCNLSGEKFYSYENQFKGPF